MKDTGRLAGGLRPIISPDKKSFTIKMPEHMCRPLEEQFDIAGLCSAVNIQRYQPILDRDHKRKKLIGEPSTITPNTKGDENESTE